MSRSSCGRQIFNASVFRKSMVKCLEDIQDDIFMIHYQTLTSNTSIILKNASLKCLHNWIHYRIISLEKMYMFDQKLKADGIFIHILQSLSVTELASSAYDVISALLSSSNHLKEKSKNRHFVSASSLQLNQSSTLYNESVAYYLHHVLILRQSFQLQSRNLQEDTFEFKYCHYIANIMTTIGEINVDNILLRFHEKDIIDYLAFLLEVTACEQDRKSVV